MISLKSGGCAGAFNFYDTRADQRRNWV